MLTIISALILGSGVWGICRTFMSNPWAITCGVVVFLAIQLAVGLYIRKKINGITEAIQMIMEKAQNKINRQMNRMQSRPVSSPKAAQQMLEKDQNLALQQSIKETDRAKSYYLWNIMLKKQINTMKMMLYFQLKDFKKVDELIGKSFIIDSRSIAIKAVRMYKNKDNKLEKYLSKKCKKAKNDDAVLLYSLYSWILVKQEKYSEAAQILADAKKKVDNQVINDNRDRLVNGKVKHFSNANLGEMWYALYLEEPKVKQQRVVQRGF